MSLTFNFARNIFNKSIPKRVQFSTIAPISLWSYIETNRIFLQPPVCNKMMYNGQLQVMIVGGPNQREVYF
jgi:hypothetical protein